MSEGIVELFHQLREYRILRGKYEITTELVSKKPAKYALGVSFEHNGDFEDRLRQLNFKKLKEFPLMNHFSNGTHHAVSGKRSSSGVIFTYVDFDKLTPAFEKLKELLKKDFKVQENEDRWPRNTSFREL